MSEKVDSVRGPGAVSSLDGDDAAVSSWHAEPGSASAAKAPPMVRRIQGQLRDHVREGVLSPGAKLPSMRELATRFGCSLGIVKQAVNTLVAQGYLRSSPRRGVYVAEAQPVGREVVLVLPHLEIERLHVSLLGVRRGLGSSGHRITIQAGAGPSDEHSPIPDYLSGPQVAGVLLMLPSAGEHEGLQGLLRRRGIPTVVVDISPRTIAADVVAIDPVETGRAGTAYLLERGHRSIGLVEPEGDVRVPVEVVAGVEAALAAAGMDPRAMPRCRVPRPVLESEPAWRLARAMVREMLGRHPSLTALIGVGPQMALGSVLGARQAGRSVPEDVSVLGLLGDSSGLQTADPPVTIFDNPLIDVCEQAAIRLLHRIDGLSAAPESIRRPPVLIERESVSDRRGRGAASA